MQRSNVDDDFECTCRPPAADGSCAFQPIVDQPVGLVSPPGTATASDKAIPDWDCMVRIRTVATTQLWRPRRIMSHSTLLRRSESVDGLNNVLKKCSCTVQESCSGANVVPQCLPP
jgi:hypothetical protein